MYWSKLTLFCNKNFISFSFFFLFRLASTLLLRPTWYQTHPVMTWERHLLLIKHSLMASLFVCCIHSIFTYLFEKYCLVANKKRCVAFCKKKILKISMIIFSHKQMSAKVVKSLNQLNSVKKRMKNLQTAAMIFHQV